MTMSVLDWEHSIRGKTLRFGERSTKNPEDIERKVLVLENKKSGTIDDFLESDDDETYIEDLNLTMSEFKRTVENWKRKNLK